MKHAIVFTLLLGQFFIGSGQGLLKRSDSLALQIGKIRGAMAEAESDSATLAFNDSLKKTVELFLDEEDSFERELHVSFLGDLMAPDKAFRMVTWNVPLGKGEYLFENYVQRGNRKGENLGWVELIDRSFDYTRSVEFKQLKHTKWFGALYYEIIPKKRAGKTIYTLLGWDGHTKFSNRKILDAMYFDGRGNPRFGYTLFKGKKKTKRRVILEHTEDARMSLRYYERKDRIVFNHLEPMKPDLEDIYEYYVPAGGFDAFVWDGKHWILEEEVEFNAPKNDKPFFNPFGKN